MRVFKWLTLVLFAYVITAFLAHPDWRGVLRSTFIPHVRMDKRVHVGARGNSGHDDFALPVLLAGIAGSRDGDGELAATTVPSGKARRMKNSR